MREDSVLADKVTGALNDEEAFLAKRQVGNFHQTRDKARLNSLKLPFFSDAHSLLRCF